MEQYGPNTGQRVAIDIDSTGTHQLNLWVREDGTKVDRILLTQDANFTPSGIGPVSTTTANQQPSTVRVFAKGHEGGESFDLIVDGQVVASHSVTTGLQEFVYNSPDHVKAGQVPRSVYE